MSGGAQGRAKKAEQQCERQDEDASAKEDDRPLIQVIEQTECGKDEKRNKEPSVRGTGATVQAASTGGEWLTRQGNDVPVVGKRDIERIVEQVKEIEQRHGARPDDDPELATRGCTSRGILSNLKC